MARPQKQVNADQVRKLAEIFCTTEEIAAVCECSKDTIERRFAALIKAGRERGRESLKRQQYKIAMTGNPTMLIWLGKQHLGQTDREQQNIAGNMRIEVVFRDPAHANGNGRLTHADNSN